MNTKSVLFGEKAAGVYRMSEIYFPSKYEGITPEQSGKIVPAVGSLVVDDTTGLHNQQYTVTSVDPITYEPTLIPSTFVVDSTAQVDRVLSYGNDVFMLYFSSVTVAIEGSNVNLTRLIVDNKLSLFGNHAATYQLVRTNPDDGTETVISRRYEPGNNPRLIPNKTSIPMLDTGVEGIRKCDGCYTEETLTEGEDIRCDIYTAGGILIAQIHLIAKKGHLLNEPVDAANPIVDMIIEGSQMDADGNLYLFYGQNESELAIYVRLLYANGDSQSVAIDNKRGFCYNLDLVSSSIAGAVYEILVKYYLAPCDSVDPSSDIVSNEGSNGYARYISKTAKIIIKTEEEDRISKVSPIPFWDSTNNRWVLQFLRYRANRLMSPYHTNDPEDKEYVTIVDNTFNGSLFGSYQTVTISYNEVVNYNDEDSVVQTVPKTETFAIKLKQRNTTDTTFAENFLIKEAVTDEVEYGNNVTPHIRPRIVYTAGSNGGYFVPDEVFRQNSTQSAAEVFVENFYTNAKPPKLTEESAAPVPTHFRIKLADGTAISRVKIPITNFSNNLQLIIPHNQQPNYYVGQTVVVEFLKQIDTVSDEILYGVPVEVIARTQA